MAKRPYMKLWKSNWRDGTKALTPMAKLLYFEIIMLLDDYEGSIPDDVHWIRREAGKHDIRQVTKPLAELKRVGKLKVVDGRIVNERVSSDHEPVEPKKPEGKGGGGTGSGSGGQGTLPLLRSIDGGRLSPETVDNHGDERRKHAGEGGDCGPTERPLCPHCAPTVRNGDGKSLISNGFSKSFYHSHSHRENHEVVVAGYGYPRARGDPASLRA